VDVTDLDADPLRQLAAWLDAARAAGQPMPEAMTIASATSDAVPSARLVVLRGLRRGLVFFTDCESDKGAELAAKSAGGSRTALACSGPPPGTRGRAG
jgi:pyridoxamine 5'-phosphate oxidase